MNKWVVDLPNDNISFHLFIEIKRLKEICTWMKCLKIAKNQYPVLLDVTFGQNDVSWWSTPRFQLEVHFDQTLLLNSRKTIGWKGEKRRPLDHM